jgi:beta-lactamase superfamily II metal-dependent hydrolase
MKLTVFQSEKGDCLLLTSQNARRHLLVDGGMRTSYQAFVAPALGCLAAGGKTLDLVYVSHIDQDHIAGVLQLMDDMVVWRVHDFQVDHGNPMHPVPTSARPPQVQEIWHNAFHEQVGENAGAIGDMLAATTAILSGSADTALQIIATAHQDLATSIPEALKLSRRISADQLNIPLNKRFQKKLAFVRTDEPPPRPMRLGSLHILVIGPFEEDLDRLRQQWNTWLTDNQEQLAKIQKQAQRDAARLGTDDIHTLLELRIAQAQFLGDRTKVTPPNLASLMLLIMERGKTVLLPGDGHAADILKGLNYHGMLNADGRLHVNVLKVQHHGSEHNIDEAFMAKVTADHYVFCGNGEHKNPDLRVIEALIEARLGNVACGADNPQASGPFTLWFNSSASASRKAAAQQHMRQVQDLVAAREGNSGGRLHCKFLEGATASFEFVV